MNFFDFTFNTPAENLACDEVLLDLFEERGSDGVLRLWEPQNYFVVVGYANEVAKEVNIAACNAGQIPIFRRCSGGGTVLQGPGCLNYSLVAPIDEDGPLHSIATANHFIMDTNRAALESKFKNRDSKIETAGHTDLVLVTFHPSPVSRLKFSGNAQRRKKHFLLFHGTFLLNFEIPLVEKYLRMPSKQPAYRKGRSHHEFLTNLNWPADELKRVLRDAWKATGQLKTVPLDAIELLARNKYVTKEWNFKF